MKIVSVCLLLSLFTSCSSPGRHPSSIGEAEKVEQVQLCGGSYRPLMNLPLGCRLVCMGGQIDDKYGGLVTRQ